MKKPSSVGQQICCTRSRHGRNTEWRQRCTEFTSTRQKYLSSLGHRDCFRRREARCSCRHFGKDLPAWTTKTLAKICQQVTEDHETRTTVWEGHTQVSRGTKSRSASLEQ